MACNRIVIELEVINLNFSLFEWYLTRSVLILDEIFDGSLDASATDLLLQLLDEVSKDANIFVISHKGDILNDKFHSILKIEKRNDFSVIC